MDGRTGLRGRAAVRVLVDGKPWVIGGTGTDRRDRLLPVRLDVARGTQLTLAVDFARFGDVQAHVDWADARLINNQFTGLRSRWPR